MAITLPTSVWSIVEVSNFQDDAERREKEYQRVMSPGSHWTSPLGQTLSGLDHWYPLWRQAHMTGQWAPIIDELLASPELTAEQRKNLRCYVAAVCHLVSEPDFNARGSMAHLGTVNMAIIRFLALTEAAVLIPDHPRAREWLDASEQFVRAKLAANTAPGGGWSELFTYHDAELNHRCVGYADLLSALPKNHVPRELVSTWTPGIGAVLRAHGGNPNETLLITSVGPIDAQQDTLVVMYPQGERESPPKTESIADGVAKITTSEGIDWVFLDRRPLEFATADISFKGLAGAVRVCNDEVHLVLAEGPGEVGYKGTVLKSSTPTTRIIAVAQLRSPQTIEVSGAKPATTFALDPKQGEITQIVRGVRRQKPADGYAFSFEAAHLIGFFYHGVVFVGQRGGIVVDEANQTVRLVMTDGEKIGCGKFLAWGCHGPYDLTIHADRVTGRSVGQGRFLNLVQPAGIDKMASLTIDGITYVPGTSESVPAEISAREPTSNLPPALDRTLVVPLMPGEHEFELHNLPQSPIFRELEEW